MHRALPVVLVLAVLSLAFAVPAQAVLITVNFTVTANAADPVNAGATANGSFSFDSSIIPPLGGPVPALDPSGLSFSWTGTNWTDANASFGGGGFSALVFDAAGNLTAWNLFGDPNGAGISTGPGRPDDFWILGGSDFFYWDQGSPQSFGGSITWSTTTSSVPEPASWLLLGGALVGLVGVRRRARK